MGKTALSVKLAEQVQADFEWVIWRSLRNAPPVQDLLADLLNVLSTQHDTALPSTVNGQLSRLIDYLQTGRCLLVLDNAESILISEERAGAYRTPGGYCAEGAAAIAARGAGILTSPVVGREKCRPVHPTAGGDGVRDRAPDRTDRSRAGEPYT